MSQDNYPFAFNPTKLQLALLKLRDTPDYTYEDVRDLYIRMGGKLANGHESSLSDNKRKKDNAPKSTDSILGESNKTKQAQQGESGLSSDIFTR